VLQSWKTSALKNCTRYWEEIHDNKLEIMISEFQFGIAAFVDEPTAKIKIWRGVADDFRTFAGLSLLNPMQDVLPFM
jgi:hypothetical protein